MKSYQARVGDYLSVLTAQRTLWSAKTTLLSLQQTDLNNGSPSGSRWAAAPVKLTAGRPSPASTRNRYGTCFLSWALILGLLSGIGPAVPDFYLPALPRSLNSYGPPAPRQLSLTAALIGLGLGQLFSAR